MRLFSVSKKTIFLLSITIIITGVLIVTFYPNYNSEFPLFTDITTVGIFLPAYFVLFCGLIPLLCVLLIKNRIIKISLIIVITIFALYQSINYLTFYSLQMRLILNIISFLPVLIFWVIVIYIKEFHQKQLGKNKK